MDYEDNLRSSFCFRNFGKISYFMLAHYLLTMLTGIVLLILTCTGLCYFIRNYTENRERGKRLSPPAVRADSLTPLRLQAFERFVLFLERSNPPALSIRMNHPELTAIQLQSLMVKTIREEFDYNLSQQLYISEGVWDKIRNAKEESISLINQAVAGLPAGAMSGDLVTAIYTLHMEKDPPAWQGAISEIRREMEQHLEHVNA